ncbi:MAG TPA: nucleotidyltransferase domain-containing protein [Candidatus Limnocylindrales bacterium]|nr:nucleotidyltransferase domain-containing protein [Candidatus Limnocylindrales bacterium]
MGPESVGDDLAFAVKDAPTDPLEAYVRLLVRAAEEPAVVGVVAFGSRAVGADITAQSDVDCFVVVDGSDEETRAWSTPHGASVEVWPVTLDAFRSHALPGDEFAWNRPSFIRARVDLDKLDGEVAAIVDAKRRLAPDEGRALVDAALDDAINSIYRALKSVEAGRLAAARLDAVEAIGPLLTTAFALESRVRPWNRWLEHELAEDPLRTTEFAGLLDVVAGLAGGATADQLRDAFRLLEGPARSAGHGPIVDGWEPDVAWLRGERAYREG